ncbi:hypothetical protein PAXRUDRAFT_158067, partial [Paxillus rubicundulus Ve08.2h10]
MDDDLKCFGCQKSFQTQKRLRGHEAVCPANTKFKTDLLQSQKHLKKVVHSHGKLHMLNPVSAVPDDEDVRPFSPTAEPMQIDRPSGSALEPESGISAVVSARSGRQVRLPARYTDYLP